jgi:hypothetical protein
MQRNSFLFLSFKLTSRMEKWNEHDQSVVYLFSSVDGKSFAKKKQVKLQSAILFRGQEI